MSSLLVFDAMIVAVFLASAWYFLGAMRGGLKLAHGFNQSLLDTKRGDLNGVMCTLGVGVTLIVMRALATDNHLELDALSLIHYTAVAVFVVSFILLRTLFTGERYPQVHRPLTYVCAVGFLVTLGTGFFQMWRLWF